MASIKDTYKIKILNWSKHQQGLKKGHSYFLFSKRFFDDPKISLLNQNQCLLFINCLCIAADFMSDSFEIHSRMFPDLLRIDSKSLSNSLESLQSFQLLTYEKITLNRIEKKRKEKNRKEIVSTNVDTCSELKSPVPNPPAKKEQVLIKIYDDKEIGISKQLINSWSDTFPKEFLEIEFKKARSWLITNSHRSPKKNYGRFFNNWFNRGWEQYRKTLSSNPVKITVEDLQDSIERWSL